MRYFTVMIFKMCLDLNSFLPKCLHSSVWCFVLHPPGDDFPDITTCLSNGYMYEMKNKFITGILFIGGVKINSLNVFYFYEKNTFVRYYLALTLHKTLVVVRKTQNSFQILKTYSCVQGFTVFDFKSLGHPQVEICFHGTSKKEFYDFLDVHYVPNLPGPPSAMMKYLKKKLQMMNGFTDRLMEENVELKKMIGKEKGRACEEEVKFSDGKVKSKERALKLVVVNEWHRAFGKFFIFGLRILNASFGISSDLKLMTKRKNVPKFFYRFFSMPEPGKRPSPASCSINPEEELLVVGGFQIPPFTSDGLFSFHGCLVSPASEGCLKLELMTLSALTFFMKQTNSLDSCDDFLALCAICAEARLVVETRSATDEALENALKKLGFLSPENSEDKLFFSPPNGMAVFFRCLSSFSWVLHVYAGNHRQLYLLVNALYDAMPEASSVLRLVPTEKERAETNCQ